MSPTATQSPTLPTSCFVVMPFGKKPLSDGSGRSYDFDKIFRHLMAPAIQQAGMVAKRADHEKSSKLIHTDMFRDLRDSHVVLVDLSLENPNVFYELGVRHVMSNRGTVLMCNDKTKLPFDVKLSRVIQYEYDGVALDIEEVARVLPQLIDALRYAREADDPDSPVHALLERVMPVQVDVPRSKRGLRPDDDLAPFHRIVATHWAEKEEPIDELRKKFGGSAFGVQGLALRCLEGSPPVATETMLEVAKLAFQWEHYDSAARLYESVAKHQQLTVRERLTFASALAEARDDASGADDAIRIVKGVLSEIDATDAANSQLEQLAHARLTLAGLLHWRWCCFVGIPSELDEALQAYEDGLRDAEKARSQGRFRQPGRIANARLRLLLGMRKRDGDVSRVDTEGHRKALLDIRESKLDDALSISYLRWYQAIALADHGKADAADQRAREAYEQDQDARRSDPIIGHRQYYSGLRRLMEQESAWLRHPELLGRISQRVQKEPSR